MVMMTTALSNQMQVQWWSRGSAFRRLRSAPASFERQISCSEWRMMAVLYPMVPMRTRL